MAAATESRKCTKCGVKYRTKLRKGRDARGCPQCKDTKQ